MCRLYEYNIPVERKRDELAGSYYTEIGSYRATGVYTSIYYYVF